MNSRGAYDEDEMLRRAIEESKEMGTLGKRIRDESEEYGWIPTPWCMPTDLEQSKREPKATAHRIKFGLNGLQAQRIARPISRRPAQWRKCQWPSCFV